MSFDVTFPLVMLAAYGLFNLLLSAAVVLAWRAGLHRHVSDADAVLGVRLLPATASAILVLTVVLPAFVLYEPRQAHDEPGPLLVLSALFALLVLGDGIRRGLRAWRATRALLRSSQPHLTQPAAGGAEVTVIQAKEPLVGVVGGLRQRIVAARCVATACDHEEFRQVLAHEAAHMRARDNLKLLVLLTLPDALAWLRTGRSLTEQWRAATDLEADERASGADPRQRLALASALIKVARLSLASGRTYRACRPSAPVSGLEHRVRRLLAPSSVVARNFPGRRLLTCALLVPLLAVPLYASVHRLIEALVAFGR
ncbi:MAG TPA: M48 family metalloprotease [Steroidobacteraceae bacterium]|nr:M48 family metalloprotease [Steroidobacteraceae bacterium]